MNDNTLDDDIPDCAKTVKNKIMVKLTKTDNKNKTNTK